MAKRKQKLESEYQKRLEKIIQERYDGIATKFCDDVGISTSTISSQRNGDLAPSSECIILISKKTGISADWILGLIPEENMDGNINVTNIKNYTGLTNKAIEKLHSYNQLSNTLDEIEIDYIVEASEKSLIPLVLSSVIEDESASMRIAEYINTGHYAIPVNDEILIGRDMNDFPILNIDPAYDELFFELFKEYKLKQIQERFDELSDMALMKMEKHNFGNNKGYIPKKVTAPNKQKKGNIK